MTEFLKDKGAGLTLCLIIAIPAWLLGQALPLIGGPIIAILLGMLITIPIRDKTRLAPGIQFTAKKILQWAVILLGFGLNLGVVLDTGLQSLPIIVCTIAASLLIAYLFHRLLHIPGRISILIGVGSSICGGSAVAATAPVIDADNEEVAQSISVIFFFNVLAAILFPVLGSAIGFDTTSGEAFGVFAGTAINDTSSVTAAAATWDSMWGLGTQTLDKAVTVKLTRTLAIIPIVLVLSLYRSKQGSGEGKSVGMKRIFPFFILYFIAASLMTTVAIQLGADPAAFAPVKTLSKFFIVLAMAAIGLNTNIGKLIKTGGKPLILGACCWAGITAVSLLMQHILGLW